MRCETGQSTIQTVNLLSSLNTNFVATVVPMRIDSTGSKSSNSPLGIDVPVAFSKIRLTPSVGASGYKSGHTDKSLKTRSSLRPGMLAQLCMLRITSLV